MIAKFLSKLLFKVSGWKLNGYLTPENRRCVMIAAPHTSNWDFVYARAAFYLMDAPIRYTIKKEFMRFPFGGLLRSMGALPIDRSRNTKMVDAMIRIFNETPGDMCVMVTPEGTRKYQPRWRRGFYYVAEGAGVPIVLGYLDYAKKEAGIGPTIYPTGDIEADLEKIMAFYRTKQGKYPEQGVR
ncbi:1-acyl-sn-glycerol-3-phosphate acyltransferase [Pontibacter sp. BT310]|uniref:1-acyl-sn-glycerol-3-phosphate acyltransferase n=1 Tax=Pontibacter populi TaxID=890055 RepID=A0ABS6XFR6_9BACT|nr:MULTISPECIES: 1-acyl-sn-glycerol-3-phosphate acyltransferase [Pontibacter]MBJ6119972.1 1-acyl-sn-glycerol-3-phosphate acyltransferase [Pontibacter sp. BT310]MBR0572401.1 1-acyl-sn-glycerol-3-phosphate acyltransferase [Microvirga sp. STS03]MBW3366825.1 1-acyl-sn-glycerol-3-phosphate acyltransferase [Pontibacter populi]